MDKLPHKYWLSMVTVIRAWIRCFGRSAVEAAVDEAANKEAPQKADPMSEKT